MSEDDVEARGIRISNARYKMMVDDNFHYQENDRWEQTVADLSWAETLLSKNPKIGILRHMSGIDVVDGARS